MAYDKRVYLQVLREYEFLAESNQKQLEAKQEEIYNKIPRIREIDDQLYSIGLDLTRQVLNKQADAKEIVNKMRERQIDLNMEKGELLCSNGYPVDYLTLKYKCDKCNDTGYIGSKMCSCFEQKLIKAAYAQSNLASVLDVQNFDNFDFSYYSDKVIPKYKISSRKNMEHIFKQCINFVNDFDKTNKSLLLYGGTGLGKTFLSSCIAKELLDKGKTVFYQTSYKIFDLLEQYKFSKSKGESLKQQVDKIFDVDLLIIDDLGTELVNTYTSSTFFNIVNTRLMNNRKIIINTNLSMKDLVDLYSDRVISRLLGNFLHLKFFGEDIRKQKMVGQFTNN